ncbi:hypothetical protein, partial [Microcoleus sp. D2_18a_B4]|uniref:hypothetical protein n=1 Tax=Microcoleus sp. D2_18a_B4 TaxID=3055329 RepID=UPI002FD604AE
PILLVHRLCLGTQIGRLCLQFSSARGEAEPLDMDSQAEPGNQLKEYLTAENAEGAERGRDKAKGRGMN